MQPEPNYNYSSYENQQYHSQHNPSMNAQPMMPPMMPPVMQPMMVVQQPKKNVGMKIVMIIGILIVLLVIGTVVLSAVMYVWASSLAENQSDVGPFNTYIVEDATSSISDDRYDELVRLSFLSWNQDLEWSFLEITLVVENEDGSVAYECAPDGEACFVQESRKDQYWKGEETIFLQENGADICDGEQCIVSVSVNYKGRPVSGDTDSFTII